MTISVLQAVGSMHRGGIENWLLYVVRCLDPAHYRVDFLLHDSRQSHHDDELRALGCRLIQCPRQRQPWCYARNFARALKAHGPYDVIHSHLHLFGGVVMRFAAYQRVPLRIAHSHSDRSALPENRFYRSLMREWIRRYASLRVAVCSEAAADLFGPGWQEDPQIRLIRCGIDLTPFAKLVDRERIRQVIGIPGDATVIGHVGRFAEPKNHAFLVEIVAAAIASESRVWGLFIGDGPLRPLVESRVRERGISERVIFTGSRDDVPALMIGAMDVLVLPSLHEGLPLVLLEAQAAGLPCVYASNITAEAEVVRPVLNRLPLAAPPERWGSAALIAAKHRSVSRAKALSAMQASPFNISRSAEAVARLYDGTA